MKKQTYRGYAAFNRQGVPLWGSFRIQAEDTANFAKYHNPNPTDQPEPYTIMAVRIIPIDET